MDGYTNICDYKINIQKAELSFIAKRFIGKQHPLYLTIGLDIGFETAKLASGTIEVSEYYGGYYNNYKLQNSNHPLKIYNLPEFIVGIGYNKLLKNKNVIFLDLRFDSHKIIGFDRDVMHVRELGLSIGYTFFGSRSKTIYQNP